MHCFSCEMISVSRIHMPEQRRPVKSYGQRVTQYHELDYITDGGGGYVQTGDRRLEAKRGRLFFRAPGERVEGVSPYSCYYVQLKISPAEGLPLGTADVPDPLEIERLFEQVYGAFLRQDPWLDYRVEVAVNQIILRLLEQRSQLCQCKEKEILPALTAARNYLDRHYSGPVSLADLSQRFGYSKYWFAHAFTQAFGVSPMAYLRSARLTAARGMLLETGLPVEEIRLRCGYPDQAAFYRAFKQFTGCTPGEFRRRYALMDR